MQYKGVKCMPKGFCICENYVLSKFSVSKYHNDKKIIDIYEIHSNLDLGLVSKMLFIDHHNIVCSWFDLNSDELNHRETTSPLSTREDFNSHGLF